MNGQTREKSAEAPRSEAENKFSVSAPSISLPKGGGAIKGIGEKFAANPVTGTGSFTVPIAVSPGRSGFGPQLSLSYDSGAGNGPFGFGWSLSLPAITRKTDKGLPQYRDAEESDVFLLSGAEDLVPVLNTEISENADYAIKRYRPRIEGLFARIERWTRRSDGDCHWRSISKDNFLSIYGKDVASRVVDNPDKPARVFSWLICETRDDKGNGLIYEYKREDGIDLKLGRACERNRGAANDPHRQSNLYLKRIHYGNQHPLLDSDTGRRPLFLKPEFNPGWLFEVVFDYGEHKTNVPQERSPWIYRADPFSTYRPCFEVRTTRLCQRVLMFHHFPGERGVGRDCLVRSTDFAYAIQADPAYTFLRSFTQTGYRRNEGGYVSRSMPPVEFEYTKPVVQDKVEVVDPASLENLPIGVDGEIYQWIDLHGEGLPGILTEQAGAWYYRRNLSSLREGAVAFGPLKLVAPKPNTTLAQGAQFLDLASDGELDMVTFDGPNPGFFEHDEAEGWRDFRPFASRLNRDLRDPNLKFIDLNGDGHADVLITEDDAFVWHPSLAEAGFGPAHRVAQALDEEKGPRLVFADGTQSIFLADLCGDGLTDLVRVRNGEVCYWPNMGYGQFGAKVTMDNAPWFDNPDLFDHKRLRLADIDGTGATDLIYLHRDGVRLYFNESGNSWSNAKTLDIFPRVDDVVRIAPADLLGNGTACLVWTSPLPGDAGRPMRYVNLMGGQKPHLLVKVVNNLGAETRIRYAPSTKFYLQDKQDGKPWITRLPFPVHVVEHVETIDHISRNRFAARYAYHHGYFDGVEREFRGFGMVEQWDTAEMEALAGPATNRDAATDVPPVLTKTWFHTGAYLGRDRISNYFAGLIDAGHQGEYYREPAWRDNSEEARKRLLPDTLLPADLTLDEEREACRALKGSMLRQEVYALDGTAKQEHPYTVAEQNFSVRRLQPNAGNRHAVFLVHPHEAITYHYERNPADPRVQHALTLAVDGYGNVLEQASVGYGRRVPDLDLSHEADREKQTKTLVTYTANLVTNAIDEDAQPDDYRSPLPAATQTYELTGHIATGPLGRYQHADFTVPATEIPYEQAPEGGRQRRLLEHLRFQYRKDDLTALLPPEEIEPRALPGETYKLAFTPGLLNGVFVRDGQPLLPDGVAVLAMDGGYIVDPEGHWWIPAGRVFFSGTDVDERTHAEKHFFLPRRYRDPFGQDTAVFLDDYDLLMVRTEDALGNVVRAENDYRVLQAWQTTDPNRNRVQVSFEAFGFVAGTAVMGKIEENLGDTLEGFEPDLTQAQLDGFYDAPDPRVPTPGLLRNATTRIVYDLDRFQRTQRAHPEDPAQWQSSYAAVVARETHFHDPLPPGGLKIQVSFSHSDGFGREIQKKIQAEPGPVFEGGPVVNPRWVGSGWTIFNNKGKAVRQYEPFFSASHRFEFGVQAGVSPILFYDPVERVVARLHPNDTYEKVVFDPWRQVSWDVNDNVLDDPRTDPDIQGYTVGYFSGLPAATPYRTWHSQRQGAALGLQEESAANKAAAHAGTPATSYFDALGRPYLTLADNGPDPAQPGLHLLFATRVELDIEGNQRSVRDAIVQAGDALGRIVMRYAYDMLGNRIQQLSMEAGARWMLNDVAGKPIRAWDSRGHSFRSEYDPLRRPLRSFVTGADPANPNLEYLTDRMAYGEQHPQAERRNLRAKLYLHLDQAGTVTAEAHDFKGNPLQATRRLTNGTQYRQVVDWKAVDADPAALPADASSPLDPVALEAFLAPRLEADIYTSSTTYDALNRPVMVTTPHTPAMQASVIRPAYNEANLLEKVDANLRGTNLNGQPDWTPFVSGIDYDAKGQRQRIDYGNGVSTFYNYDPLTFRLKHLLSRRNAVSYPDDSPQVPEVGWPGSAVQNLSYTYDPAGNITHIRDDAQQAIYFRNQRVEPSAEYTYDAIYRLIEATGREHLGQAGGSPIPSSFNDSPRVGLSSSDGAGRFAPNDGNAMGSYVERYIYDAVGNFLKMQHLRRGNPVQGWTRSYDYTGTSLIEHGAGGLLLKTSNRLSSTTVGNGNPLPVVERYLYDAHGNMTRMPHLGGVYPAPNMHWDFRDQLCQTDLGGGGTAYHVYDSSGQRVRKVWEKSPGLVEERIYLGGFEIFRRRQGAERLQRETLHIMDDKQRIALVETRTFDSAGTDGALAQLARFQFGNHLDSVGLELDGDSQIVSYEEYTPFGSTSYQAVRSHTDTPKRYRYTGQESEEETGLCYHGVRHYAPWLGRWTAVDPIGIAEGLNPFVYVNNRPLLLADPTGQYGEAGHYYTVYFASLAAGFDENTSFRNALFSQVPDEIRDTDAVYLTAQLARVREPGFLDMLAAPLGYGGESASLAYDADQAKRVLHALTGTSSADETRATVTALGSDEIAPGSLTYGFLLHRLGDTFSHRTFEDESRTYEPANGHGSAGHAPDTIGERPVLYTDYALTLYDALAARVRDAGGTPRLTREEFAASLDRILEPTLTEVRALPDETTARGAPFDPAVGMEGRFPDEEVIIARLRGEVSNLGVTPNSYAPELTGVSQIGEFRARHTAHDSDHPARQVTLPNVRQSLLVARTALAAGGSPTFGGR